MDRLLAGGEYATHLTDADLRLLASLPGAGQVSGSGGPADGSWLRGDPAALLRLLEHPGAYDAVCGPGETVPGPGELVRGWAVPASPFLVFAVVVQRVVAELASMDYV